MKIKLNQLIEDMELYPRARVDDTHVGHLSEVIGAGSQLPRIVVSDPEKIIVDGWHRVRAWRRVFGDDASIPCELRKYDNRQAIFMDAMRLNAAHGRILSSFDRVTAIERATRMHISIELIANSLSMTVEKVKEYVTERMAKTDVRMDSLVNNKSATFMSGKGKDVKSVSVPLKQAVMHLAGQTITASQVEAIQQIGGNNQMFYVNQLILLIESRLLNKSDETLMKRLKELGKMISEI